MTRSTAAPAATRWQAVLGNDTYVVDASGDVVTEAASAGTDTVRSSVTLTLGANVENLVLTGAGAINGTGNTLNNVLTGNAASNVLSGGTGTDTMIGGAGDDTYVVDATGDVVTENARRRHRPGSIQRDLYFGGQRRESDIDRHDRYQWNGQRARQRAHRQQRRQHADGR